MAERSMKPGSMGQHSIVLSDDGLEVMAGPCDCNRGQGHWSAGARAACGARRATETARV